jgi:AcrR family transcriptional regulator
MDMRTPTASRREAAKTERKRRIVEAATALARESGLDTVSMVQIAERAEVVPATLYNLFSTKGAILRHVFDRDLDDYRRLVAEAPARDALDRIFVGVELAAALYRRDPAFYRALARGGGQKVEDLGPAISEPRIAFLQGQVADALAEGLLSPETDAQVLGVTLSQMMRGVFLEWAVGAITPGRLAKEACYGFALALLPHATAATAPQLAERMRRLQAELKGPRRTANDA